MNYARKQTTPPVRHRTLSARIPGVREVMSTPVARVALTDTPRRARDLMLTLGLHHLAVGVCPVAGVVHDAETGSVP